MTTVNEVTVAILVQLGNQYITSLKGSLNTVPKVGQSPTPEKLKARAAVIENMIQNVGWKERISQNSLDDIMVFDSTVPAEKHADISKRLMKHLKSTYRGTSMAFIDRFPKAAICIQARAYVRIALHAMLRREEVSLNDQQIAMVGFAYSIQMSTTTVEAAVIGNVPIIVKPSKKGEGLYKTEMYFDPLDSNDCEFPDWMGDEVDCSSTAPKVIKDKDNKRTGKYVHIQSSKLPKGDESEECAAVDTENFESFCDEWSSGAVSYWRNSYLFPLSKVPVSKTIEIDSWNIGADFIGRSDQHFWLPMITKKSDMQQVKLEIDKLLSLKKGDNISAAKTLKYFGQLMSPNQLGGNFIDLTRTQKIKMGKGKPASEIVIDPTEAFIMMNEVEGLEKAGDEVYDGTIFMSRELMALCLPAAYQADVMAGKYDYIVVISRFYTDGYFLKGGAQCLPPGMLPDGVHILSYGKKTNLAPVQGSSEFLGVINSGHPRLFKGAATDTQTLLNEMDWNCPKSVSFMKAMMADALTYLKYVMAKVSESYSPGTLSAEEADRIANTLHAFLTACESGENPDADEALEEVKQVSQLKELITAIQRIMSGAFAMPQMIPAIFNQMTNESMDPGRTRVPLYRYMINPKSEQMEYMPIAYSIYLQAHPGLALQKLAEASNIPLTPEQEAFYLTATKDTDVTRTAFFEDSPVADQNAVIFCSPETYGDIVARMKSSYMFFSRSPNTFSSGAWGQLVPLEGMRNGIFWIRPTKEAFQRFMANSDGADFDDRFVGTMGEFAELQIRFHEGAKKLLLSGDGSSVSIDTFRNSRERTNALGKFLKQSLAPMLNAKKASFYGYSTWGSNELEPVNPKLKQLLLRFCPSSRQKELQELLSSNTPVQIGTKGFKKLLDDYSWPRAYFQKGVSHPCGSCMEHLEVTVGYLHGLNGSTGTAANAQMDAAATLQGVKSFDHFDLDQPAPFLDEEGNVKYLQPKEFKEAVTFRDIYKFIVSEMLSNVIDADTQGQNVVEAIEVMENLYMASYYLGAHIFLNMEKAKIKGEGEHSYFNATMRRGVKVNSSPFLLKRPIGLLGDMTRNAYDILVNRADVNWDRLERAKLCVQIGTEHEIFKSFGDYRDGSIDLGNAYVHHSLEEKRWVGLRSGVDSLAAAKSEIGDFMPKEFSAVTRKRSEEIDKVMKAAGSMDKKGRLRLRKAAEETWLRETWGKLTHSKKEAYAIWTLKRWLTESDEAFADMTRAENPKTQFIKVSDRSFGSIAGDGLHTGTAYMGNIVDNDGNIVEIGPWMYFIQALNAAGELASQAGDVDETLIVSFTHDRFGVHHPERADDEHKKAHFNALNNQKTMPITRVPWGEWLKASGEELIGKIAAPAAFYDSASEQYIWEEPVRIGVERLLVGHKLNDIFSNGFNLGYLIMAAVDSPKYSMNKHYFDVVRNAGFTKGTEANKGTDITDRALLHDEFVKDLAEYTIVGVSPLVGQTVAKRNTQYAHPQFLLSVRRKNDGTVYGSLVIKNLEGINDASEGTREGRDPNEDFQGNGDQQDFSGTPEIDGGNQPETQEQLEEAVEEAAPATPKPKTLAIIGTAGRDEATFKYLTMAKYQWMLKEAARVVEETGATAVVSGGSAWCDHVAVTLYRRSKDTPGAVPLKLTLMLPAHLTGGKFEVGNTGDKRTGGGILNHYHRLFNQRINENYPGASFNSLQQLQEAYDDNTKDDFGVKNVNVYVTDRNEQVSLFERNSWVAEEADCMLAFTFGTGPEPADGGTKDTWNKYHKLNENPVAYHISLMPGMEPQPTPKSKPEVKVEPVTETTLQENKAPVFTKGAMFKGPDFGFLSNMEPCNITFTEEEKVTFEVAVANEFWSAYGECYGLGGCDYNHPTVALTINIPADTFVSSETLYQYVKFQIAELFDTEMNPVHPSMNGYASKKEAKEASKAQRYGLQVLVKDLPGLRVKVMEWVLLQKFKRSDRAAEFTRRLATACSGTETITENNTWNDTFWGVCRGKGENNLGKLLQELGEAALKQVEIDFSR